MLLKLGLIAAAFGACVLAACGPSPEQLATQTAAASTATAASWTATPTITPSPTSTPTATPTPTASPTVTPTPTSTVDPDRHVEPEGGFSYIPPEGWGVREFPGLAYNVAFGTPVNDFAPNLVFTDEAFGGSLEVYLEAALQSIAAMFPEAEVTGQEDFANNDGDEAVKLFMQQTQNGFKVRQVLYIFDGGNRKFVVTYTRLLAEQESNDVLVEASMRTFRVEPTSP